MNKILKKYTLNGSFRLTVGDSVAEQMNAPALPGIYLIFADKGKDEFLLFVGKAGIIDHEENETIDCLKDRILNDGEVEALDDFYGELMEVNGFDALVFKWYVTFNEGCYDLPSFVEAVLIQEYYDDHGDLPPLNETF